MPHLMFFNKFIYFYIYINYDKRRINKNYVTE